MGQARLQHTPACMKMGMRTGLVGVTEGHHDWTTAPAGVCEDQDCCGINWAKSQYQSIHMRDKVRVEMTRQLYPLVCVLAGARDDLNLTLYWHKSQV